MSTKLCQVGTVSGYSDIYTTSVREALEAVSGVEQARQSLMQTRLWRRSARQDHRDRIRFLHPDHQIRGTNIVVHDARSGAFVGAEIPARLQRQWVQGTGPATRPGEPLEKSLRPVAYGLLSGADGWMFDGEDALGQVASMSLDNQRNLKHAIHRSATFLRVAERVAADMNRWSESALGKHIVEDWQKQLDFTTIMFRPRALHLDDRHLRCADGSGFSASIVDTVLFVVNNYEALGRLNSPIVLYLPKIQTAEEAALWNRILSTLEAHLKLGAGAIKTYVLVEQLEACFQLMEIRAALGLHFVGFNTGRWDYINSVSDAMAWDFDFVNPNIDAITMTYGYMRHYEDRVRRAANTPDLNGRYALWQGGMEPNIPVGSSRGVDNAMQKAVAGAEREQREGASGKWVAHWKMVHIVRGVWERDGRLNQMGLMCPPLTYEPEDVERLLTLEAGPRTVRGARDLISVALQYGNAFLQGYQAVALKPADYFDNSDMLFLMEDMATGEIRLSILWEWLQKGAPFTEDDLTVKVKVGDVLSSYLFVQLLHDEYMKLLSADDRYVHDDSKDTTLPIARAIVARYVTESTKLPWLIDLLNINLDNHDLDESHQRIETYVSTFRQRGIRISSCELGAMQTDIVIGGELHEPV